MGPLPRCPGGSDTASQHASALSSLHSVKPSSKPQTPCHPQARVFQASRCALSGAPLELPAVHFFCGHSFNGAVSFLHMWLGPCCSDCPRCAQPRRGCPGPSQGNKRIKRSSLSSDLESHRLLLQKSADHRVTHTHTRPTVRRLRSRHAVLATTPESRQDASSRTVFWMAQAGRWGRRTRSARCAARASAPPWTSGPRCRPAPASRCGVTGPAKLHACAAVRIGGLLQACSSTCLRSRQSCACSWSVQVQLTSSMD